MRDFLVITAVVILLIILLGVGPLITIWSLNTLFNLAIGFNFWTWCAMVWVQLVSFGSVIAKLTQINNKLN